MRSLFVAATALVICLALASGAFGAGASIQKVSENARIDWTNLVYTASGEGAMPTASQEPNRARAYLKAKGYARMAAIANLLMAIDGTTITFEATGKDYMEDATVRQKIDGYVKNVEIVSERKEKVEGDTVVIVEVRAPMFQGNGPGSILMSKEIQEESKAEGPRPGTVIVAEASVKITLKPDLAPTRPEHIITPTPATPEKPYTGLIIDSIGYRLDRCMSPKIRRSNGSEVWGTVKVDPDLVLERGIVSYATSLETAKSNRRAGSNPLVIKAIGRAGGRFNSDPVISDDDADLLISENAKSGFLDKLNVVFVKDGRL